MRMSRPAAYAIGAILQLHEAPAGVPVPCSRLAKTGEMPERFLLQVLRNLVNHGILKSTRGVDGGYALQRPFEEITLLHIFEATDGPLAPTTPPLDSLPQSSRARLQEVLHDITADVCQSLAKVKLTELVAPCVKQRLPAE
ncbi:MAG: Rrf2 family transcriptional regulator [Pirellulales bacterium]|nr:Rrf2 family transcriptional regulator [Pirellulales bacterium]